MRYLKIVNEFEPEIIGVDNGVAQVIIDKKGFSSTEYYNRVHTFLKSKEINKTPDFEIKLEGVCPIKNMKITEFLSFSPWYMCAPFLVSQRIVEMFSTFNLPTHFYFPVSFSDKLKANQNYFMFYCHIFDYDMVDVKKSLFYNGSIILGKKFVRYDNLEENIKDFDGVECLAFNDKFPKGIDLFKHRLSGGIIISERHWKALEEINFLGIRFVNADNPEIIFAGTELRNEYHDE